MAVSWEGHTGLASLYFDGVEQTPFWRASGGAVDQEYPAKGGVDKHVAAGTARFDHGGASSLASMPAGLLNLMTDVPVRQPRRACTFVVSKLLAKHTFDVLRVPEEQAA